MRYQSPALAKAISATQANVVLRKTYFLLSCTLAFCAAMAYTAYTTHAKANLLLLIAGIFILPFIAMKCRETIWGLIATFAYAGLLGFYIGPILNAYISNYSNGAQLVTTAVGATAATFLGLTGYTLATKKNFSYLGGVLGVAVIVAFVAGLGAMFFQLSMLQLIVSAAFALIASGYILYTTSSIVNGGETSHVVATITLFASIINLFLSILQILGFFSGSNRD